MRFSKYFMWYMWFLPLVLPRLHMSCRTAIVSAGLWVGAQALWLSIAYRLELLGQNVFFSLWLASAAFLLTNNYVLVKVIQAYTFHI